MKRITFPVIFLLFVVITFSCQREKKPIVLENTFARFEFNPLNSGVVGIIDPRDQFNFIRGNTSAPQLWELTYSKEGITGRLSSADIKLNKYEILNKDNGNKLLILSWENIATESVKFKSNVTVTVELPASSGLAKWTVSIDNESSDWVLEQVEFPKIKNLLSKGGFDVACHVEEVNPWGTLFKGFDGRIKMDCSSKSRLPMSFFSVTQGANSLYLGVDNTEISISNKITFEPGVLFGVKSPANSVVINGKNISKSEPVVIGPYKGTWLEAAKIFRKHNFKVISKSENKDQSILNEVAIYFSESIEDERKISMKSSLVVDKASRYFDVPLAFLSNGQDKPAHSTNKEDIPFISIPEKPATGTITKHKKIVAKSIPLFQAVYSGLYVPLAENNQLLNLQTERFRNELGFDLVFGCVPGGVGLEILGNGNLPKKQWLRKIGKARHAANTFLVDGELVDLFDNGNLQDTENAPEIMGSVWKMKDGSLNLLVVNLTPKQKDFVLRLTPERYGIEAGKFDISLLYADEGGISTLDDIVGSEVLYPYEIRIFKAVHI